MLPRTRGLIVLFTILWTGSAGFLCHAQQSGPLLPVRYHFGDDLRWADPDFNDSAWPLAQNGRWPLPAFYSDGFVWVRFQVPVRTDLAGTLAILASAPHLWTATEVFVNGKQVGRFGSGPPHERVQSVPRETVFDLPAGLASPGAIANVAFREWYTPMVRQAGALDRATVQFDQSRTLHADEELERERALLRNLPPLALNLLFLLIGLAILGLWVSTRSRELLLVGNVLIAYALLSINFETLDAGMVNLPLRPYLAFSTLLNLIAMWAVVEFIWGFNGLQNIWFKRIALSAMAATLSSWFFAFLPSKPSRAVAVSLVILFVAQQVFNMVTIAANLWVLFVLRKNMLIAGTMALIPIASILLAFSTWFRGSGLPGPFNVFYIASFTAGFTLSTALVHRAWKEWRARDELRVEFNAAREVQQQLVAPAADIPGFSIESVYAPAKQVGGDFFRILPEANGGVLVVVGDVSGKGLKAAMTVSTIIGALRGCSSFRPAEILEYLNRVLFGQVGGFVTCCVALIANDGVMTLANAGNPAPYRNGEEMAVPSGLPLGLLAEGSYEQTRYQIAPEDRLTFVSDGVLEATNAKGELYGFERTQAVSNQTADTIAEAARQFGQQDDITVVSLTRTRAEESAPLTFPSLP